MRQKIHFTGKSLLATALAAGIPIISSDTAARVCAAVYVCGNNEALVSSPKLKADLDYISERFGVHGSGTPSERFSELLKKYVYDLEHFRSETPYDGAAVFHQDRPQWVDELFKQRYGIKLIN